MIISIVGLAALAAVDVPDLKHEWTPAELAQACEAAEKTCDAALEQIAKVPAGKHTFKNSFEAYEQAITDYGDATGRLGFMKEVHPDAEVRKAAAACEARAGKYFVQVSARKDLYQAMKDADVRKLDAVDRRLVEITLRDFRRNGLELPDEDRQKLIEIRSRLAELGTQFSSNLDENTDTIEATAAELKGLPEEFIARLKKAPSGKYIVTTKYPDYYPMMDNAADEGVRKRLYLAFNGREAKRNLPILKEAIALRDRAARLLGFASHADFVTDNRMAKSAQAVGDFLARLRGELVPRLEDENQKMLALKVTATRDPRAVMQDWDWRYWQNQIKKRDYAIDDEEVRRYFPADKVLAGMFQVYSTLFNVTFKELPQSKAWADGVKLYEIREAPRGRLLAKFYIDLFPRDGKYGHAASFTFGAARQLPRGYQVPLSALVVNFNPPANGKAAHLSLNEVETLFHEFGHIMHGSLTTARYNSLAGTNVAVDFLEAPSQMLENWVFRPEILKLISEDPNDAKQPMPEELARRLVAARTYDAGVKFTRQVFLASLDQWLHTHGADVDPDAVEHRLRGEIVRYPVDPGEHFVATFGHLMGGYDAGYYGYLWSEVFSADMFSRFEKEGVLNPKTGRAYRDIILAKGRVEEPGALLKQFLGREPNDEAFLRLTGIKR
ncbi:MAG TPA: M3 family metallopeptidase [Polyangia bacterium]|nr:M3 family metallopeptidase [Polyangia bacterium]